MKVLFVTPYRSYSGGVESINKALQSILEADGHRVDYLTAEQPLDHGTRMLKRLVGLPAVTARGYRRIASRDYDLVIANGEYALGIDHPRVICVFHGSYRGFRDHLAPYLSAREYLSFSWQALIQRVAARAKHVVAVSSFVEAILERQGIKVARVIENCVDTHHFQPGHGEQEGRYLFVGSYHRYGKGFDVLETLARKGLQIDCVTNVPPGGGLRRIEPRAQEHMPDLYRRYRLVIFPSRFEACGLVSLEAMSCGLPVVTTDVGIGRQMRQTLPDFVVDVRAENMAEEILQRIARIESRYEAYSAAARSYVLQRHSYAVFRDQWRELVSECARC